MKKRLTIILLIAAMLTSCGGGTTTETTTTTDTTNTQQTETETTDPRSIPDDVPDLDFGGAAFRSIGQKAANQDMYVEEETGDTLNDVIYIRNRGVEERLNVVIAPMEETDYTVISSKAKQCVTAGDDAYDLVMGQMENAGKDAQAGLFRNWYDIPYVDFEKPWYPKSVTNGTSSINGRMYNIVSDMLLSFAKQTWVVVFDKVQAESYQITDLYDRVYSGEWTLDYILEIADTVYTDLNGDGKADESDYYAFTSCTADGCLMAAFLYGSGVSFAQIQGDKAVMTLNNEKSVSVYEKLHELFYNTQGVWNTKSTWGGDKSGSLLYDQFIEGNTLFGSFQLGSVATNLREYENDYGVLPIPKYDAEQKDYATVTDAGCSILSVLTTATQLDMIGAVTECLSAESYRSVLPTYYDVTLGSKVARSPEDAEMIDYVLQTRQIDFAYMYDGWGGWVFKAAEFIQKADEFASIYAKHEKSVQTYYDEVMEFFHKIEE